MMPQRLRQIALVIVALCFGAFASYQTRTRATTHHADFYCYEMRPGWVCTYAREDCLARQEREAAGDVTKRCAAHDNDVLTP